MKELEYRLPPPLHTNSLPSYIPSTLSSCSHVFVRVDSIRKPLEPPYMGPFRVVSRSDTCFIMNVRPATRKSFPSTVSSRLYFLQNPSPLKLLHFQSPIFTSFLTPSVYTRKIRDDMTYHYRFYMTHYYPHYILLVTFGSLPPKSFIFITLHISSLLTMLYIFS